MENPAFENIVDEIDIVDMKRDLQVLRLELAARERVEKLTALTKQQIQAEELAKLEYTLKELRHAIDDKHCKEKGRANQFFDEASKKLKSCQRKRKLTAEIKQAFKAFDVPFSPDYLQQRKDGVALINQLKIRSVEEGDSAFSVADEEKLQHCTMETKDLEEKTLHGDKVHTMMRTAIKKYSYTLLAKALEEAEKAFFLDEDLLRECTELVNFLNPDIRIEALRKVLESRDIDEVTKAVDNYKIAKVTKAPGPELLKKAEKRLTYLHKVGKLNDMLRDSIAKNDKEALHKALKKCYSNPVVKCKDIPLYREAENQLELLRFYVPR